MRLPTLHHASVGRHIGIPGDVFHLGLAKDREETHMADRQGMDWTGGVCEERKEIADRSIGPTYGDADSHPLRICKSGERARLGSTSEHFFLVTDPAQTGLRCERTSLFAQKG